jgi:hypothetical protein
MPYLSIPIQVPESGTTSAISHVLSEQASTLAKMCAQPCPPGDYVKAAIGRAADRSGLPFRRVRDLWYRDARRIDAWEMEQLRTAADAAEVDIAVAGIEVARRRLQATDSKLAREAIAALDRASRVLGGGTDAPRRRSTDRG